MTASSSISGRVFKSPPRVVVKVLLESRERHARKARERNEEIGRLRAKIVRLNAQVLQERQNTRQALDEVRRVEKERQLLARQSIRLPDDSPLGTHGYGARMVSLCVNLARIVGLRATPAALRLVMDWLSVDQPVPHWTSIRFWMKRMGVAELTEPIEAADDWVWLSDHSNQIGPEKVLVVLGVRASQLPPPGEPLRHENMRVLMVQPGTEWKREDVAGAYQKLAERCGAPRAVLMDGAVELRDGVEALKASREDTIVLRDFKHYAANQIKSLVGGDERFKEFSTKVGHTRSTIQQTELAHLTPPGVRPKSRFMNLGGTLRWASLILWLLNNPAAKALASITPQRLLEKLGWLTEYAADIAVWCECQAVVSAGVTFINEQGLTGGAAQAFRQLARHLATQDTSRTLLARLLQFLRQSQILLRADERLPMSTEILESTFGLYKQLERQHSRGGFTKLLAAFGALLRPATPELVRKSFARVKVKDVKAWTDLHLGETLNAKRQTAYQQFKRANSGATKS